MGSECAKQRSVMYYVPRAYLMTFYLTKSLEDIRNVLSQHFCCIMQFFTSKTFSFCYFANREVFPCVLQNSKLIDYIPLKTVSGLNSIS